MGQSLLNGDKASLSSQGHEKRATRSRDLPFFDNAKALEQSVAKCSWIFVQIRISNELNKMTLKCKADQTAEFVK